MDSLAISLKDSARPVFLFGLTPPRDGTSEGMGYRRGCKIYYIMLFVEAAKEACLKFAQRSAVLATDGFIVYVLTLLFDIYNF